MQTSKKRKSRIQKAKRVIIETRTCPICGNEFGINVFQKNKVYCDNCRHEHYIEAAKAYRRDPENAKRRRELARSKPKKRKPPRTYICKLCGEPFEFQNRGKPRYCMTCLEEAYKNNIHPYKEYYERRVFDEDLWPVR